MSDRNALREAVIHRDRRIELELLYSTWPLSYGEEDLFSALEQLVPREFVARDIEALTQHGLLSRTWEKPTPFSPAKWMLKLTVKGEEFCRRGYDWTLLEKLTHG